MKRRHLLQNMATLAVGATLAPGLSMAEGGAKKRYPWRNWSGSQICYPQARKAPSSLAELQSLIVNAPGVVRPVGAGHSFMPLVSTDDTLISMSRMSGLIEHDAELIQARVHAGTRLGDLGDELAAVNQAMINMPDIDEQALAGALGTATHGTGAGIGCLPTFVEGVQLVAANGDILECNAEQNPEVFMASRVCLGALGVISAVTLQNIPSYRLKRETVWRSFEEMIETAESLADSNRNFEFYYIPFTGMGYTDVHNVTEEPLGESEKVEPNEGVMDLKHARDFLSWSPALRELILGTYMSTLPDEHTVAASYDNYANERNVRFNEMEYHLPREEGLKALKEIRELIESKFPEVFFPLECRYVKADDIWLSPFYKRDTFSIAVHRYFEEDYLPFFKAIEPIFLKYGGRPHWGKLNTMEEQAFAKHYPRWNDFLEVRRELDPNGKFLNPYLKKIFKVS